MASNKLIVSLFILFLSLFSKCILAQENDAYYFFVAFQDKESISELKQANTFLSQKAIDRRAKSNISIVAEDLPISKNRIKTISSLQNTKFHYALKWQNGVVVSTPDPTQKENYLTLDFVENVKIIKKPASASRNSMPTNIIDQ